MYGIFTYIYPKKTTIHVGKYACPMDPTGLMSYWLGNGVILNGDWFREPRMMNGANWVLRGFSSLYQECLGANKSSTILAL